LPSLIVDGSTSPGVYSSPDGLIVDPTTGAFIPSNNAADTFTVVYTIPAAYTAGCGDVKGTTEVVITEKPDITSFYYNGTQPFCKSAGTITPTISVTPAVSHTGVFSYTPTVKHLEISATTGAIDLSLSDTGTYVIKYQLDAKGGCTGDPETTTVTIKNCTDISFDKTALPTTVCSGHEVVFTLTLMNNSPIDATDVEVTDVLLPQFTYVSSLPGGSYDPATHKFTLGTVAAGATVTLTITATATTTVSGIYTNEAYVSKVNADEYGSYAAAPNNLKADEPITINPTPTASITSPSLPSPSVCEGSTLGLAGNGAGTGGSYLWRLPNSVRLDNPSQTPSITNIVAADAGEYWLIVTNSYGCQDSTSITIAVNPKPTATASSNSPVCENDTLKLTGGETGTGYTYEWTGPGISGSSSEQNPKIDDVPLAANGTYRLIVTTAEGCSDTAFVTVVVNELPNFTVGSNSPVCIGTSLELDLNIVDPANYNYSWTGPGITGSNVSQQEPTISPAAAAHQGWYKVTVTNPLTGCWDTASVYVTVKECTNLTLTKTADATAICNGNDLVFTIIVINNASSPAANVTVVDTLSPGFNIHSLSSTNGSYNETTHKWTLTNNIAVADADTLIITVTTDTVGVITNKAYIATGGATINNNSYDEAASGHKDFYTVTVVRTFIAPDIRVDVCPSPGRSIHLTKFLDSLNYSNVHWDRITSAAPTIINPTGTINTADFHYHSTYTYQYTYNSAYYSGIECGTTSARAYVQSLTDRQLRKIDTIVVCRKKELSAFINLNQLLGMEFGGVLDVEGWEYGSTVNPDNSVVSKVKLPTTPSIWAGARIFDAIAAWNDITNPAYSITYKGDTNAKKFNFRYSPQSGSCIIGDKNFVIIVTDKMF
jgi:uncharacterized repeat protein (TIGR01451 family)